MRIIIQAIMFGLSLISVDIVAQNESLNCKEARKKYLELNPDVAKAGMDAWIHYSNYGKREGRIWPLCPNSIAEIAKPNPIAEIVNPNPSNDSLFKDIASIGSNSKKEISQYNINNIHNQFDFNEKPFSVLSGSPNEAALKLNGLREKEILDNFLRGVDSLPIIIKDIEKSLSKYPKISLEGYYNTSMEFSNYISTNKRIIVSKNYKSLNKLKDLGSVRYKNDSFSYLIIPPGTYSKRLEKKLAKLITKNTASLINKDNAEDYIRGIYNVTREYQGLCENLIKLKKMRDYSSLCFKVLNAPDESYKNFNYVGQLNNGAPAGFGYLLNNSKQLICSAFWHEGFPVVLYSVNNYHNSKSIDQFHRYISPISSNGKNNKRKIDFDVSDYSNSDIRTFNIYVGECNEKNIRSGFGCYFFEGSDKASLQYYKGNWGGSGDRIGEGTQYSNGVATSGKWINGEISNGTITWPDNSTYTGAINKYRMNGMGKKTYSNGKIEEGLFENGSFSKSLAQIQQERIQEEQILQERIQQELIQQELIRQEESKRIAAAEKEVESKAKKSDNRVYDISATEFANNTNKYLGKTVIVEAFYSNSINAGAYSEVADMTLRSQGSNFENIYAIANYSFNNNEAYIRRAEILGNKINLIIPKSLSQEMPNYKYGNILITGRVVSPVTIEVKRIQGEIR